MPPTTTVSRLPTMMNQRTNRTGRARPFWSIGLPERWGSVAIFMSCARCGDWLGLEVREIAGQMVEDCGVVKADAAKQEFAELALETADVAIPKTGHGGKARHRRRQHGMVGKPEQIDRLAADSRGIAGGDRGLERGHEHRPDQLLHLGIEQARELTVVEMAGDHQ